jgi:PTS system mannose-specific IIB component/fructoselysine and glucoselysine-specific PTS system IIB component
MPIALYRVDERLIHGQVVIGWGTSLRPVRYLVVDRSLAESEWERELYVLGLPEGTSAVFVSPEEAREQLQSWKEDEAVSLLLTRDIETMVELARGGLLREDEVNLGGIHFQMGRKEILPYLFLAARDRELLEELRREGALVSAQDLPGSSKVPLDTLLA